MNPAAALLLANALSVSQVDFRLIEVRTVGGGADDDVYFTRVTAIAHARRGEVWIASSEPAIIVSPDRGEPRRIARKGAGPGEFQEISGLFVRGDTVIAVDAISRRLTRFLPGGAVDTYSYRFNAAEAGSHPNWPIGVLSDGSVLAIVPRTAGRESTHIRSPVLRVQLPSGPADTLTAMNSSREFQTITFGRRYVQFRAQVDAGDRLAISTGGEYVAVARNSPPDPMQTGFTVDVWSVTTEQIRSLPIRHAPPPISRDDELKMRAAFADRISNIFERPVAERLARDSLHVPRAWPAVDHVFVADDGRIFLKHPLSTVAARWSVLDMNGLLLGRIMAPADLVIRAVQGSRVAAVRKDELGVETVTVYELVPTPRRIE